MPFDAAHHEPQKAWTPPVYVCKSAEELDAPYRAGNYAKLQKFVAGHIDIARGKTPAEAVAHLNKWADHVGKMAAQLLDAPFHLRGLNAFDISEAVERLQAEAAAQAVAQ